MQYADPDLDWTEWLANNEDRDEATKLAALREYIVAVARKWVRDCTYDEVWANKKFGKLGITERFDISQQYVLQVAITADLTTSVYAASRTEALEKFNARIAHAGGNITNIAAAGDPVFSSGPEDPDPLGDPDAPQTVGATLALLREIILLGHIAGPRICEAQANQVLASFGLAPIPERRTFKVSRPVDAVMTTTVEAYDEESATRIAGWRWESNRSGYNLATAEAKDAPSVAAV